MVGMLPWYGRGSGSIPDGGSGRKKGRKEEGRKNDAI